MTSMPLVDPFQVIAEPRRRSILQLVWDEELAAGDIAESFDVTFGAISQHLSVLRSAGFVQMRKLGNKRMYSADKEGLGALRPVLESMWTETLDRLAETIESDLANGGER